MVTQRKLLLVLLPNPTAAPVVTTLTLVVVALSWCYGYVSGFP